MSDKVMCTCPDRPDPDWNGRHEDECPWMIGHRAAQAASKERVRDAVAEVCLALLTERNLYIVKPQSPTIGEMALEAYGHGKACDAAALLGDDLQAVLTTIASRVADQLATPAVLSADARRQADLNAEWIPPSRRIGDPGPCTAMAHHWATGSKVCRCGDATRDDDCRGWRVESRLTDDQIYETVTGAKRGGKP